MLGILIVVIFSAILLPKIRYVKDFEENTISLQTSQNLKGILCVAVFFNHFTGWFTDPDPVMYILVHCGTFAVSAFFFLSAYGLKKKYATSAMSFKELVKKLFYLMIPYWICEIIYCVISIAFNIPIKVTVNLKNILIAAAAWVDKSEIVENAWFVTVILLMYIIFFIAYRYSPLKNKTLFFAILFAAVTVISKGKWISTSVAFLLGVVFVDFESEIKDFLKKKYILSLFLTVILIFAGIAVKFIGQYKNSNVIMDLSDTITSVFFPILIYILTCHLKIGNIITKFLCRISYKVYLIHGLMIRVSYEIWGRENRIMLCLTALALTVAASFVIDLIDTQLKKLLNRPKAAA